MWKGVSAWYPPAGLEVAVLVGLGFSYMPVILLANFVSAIVNYHQSPRSAAFWVSCLVITAGYSGGAFILRRILPHDSPFRSVGDVFRYLTVAITTSFWVASVGKLLR